MNTVTLLIRFILFTHDKNVGHNIMRVNRSFHEACNQTVNSIIRSRTFIAQRQMGIGNSKFDPQSLTALL